MPRAVVYTEFGAPEVLRMVEIPSGRPGAGQLRIRIEAAGVNPVDAKLRSGRRASPPIDAPRRAGADGAGVVLEVGDDVDGFRPGLPVTVFDTLGTYADEVVVPAASVVPRPPAVSAVQAAALGVPVGTAYQSLRSLRVGPGDTLLVHGGSGAVGRAAVQYAVLWGARVIATSSDRRAPGVRELGATTVPYGEGLTERVRDAAPEGITVALDCVGTDEAVQTSLDLVADRSRIVTLVRGAEADELGIRAFRGGSPHPLTEREAAWRREAIPVTLGLLAAGAFSVELGPALPLSDAADAQRLVARGTDGKIILLP
ncbi:quinone oxidoreductase family protein [Microbacterium lushaniae]|uniref:NADP-dependent oxidoreductase n=1 Tax=Microbacterium lushaniae TaxID=2614639 RepID=A0A5J6L5P7_9MICO|nr:NADP-dependent oxidoreductase [Microbacterium lushaniae]QEW03696.1 NADP-dependent oxidoreductase [Microbacterium lushaniae]